MTDPKRHNLYYMDVRDAGVPYEMVPDVFMFLLKRMCERTGHRWTKPSWMRDELCEDCQSFRKAVES